MSAFFRLFNHPMNKYGPEELISIQQDLVKARHEIEEHLNDDIEWGATK